MNIIKNLPILNLNKDNIESEWQNLLNAINSSSFVAIDLEMSGLGNRKKINTSSIEERYRNINEVASIYSILSLGVSCFRMEKLLNDNGNETMKLTNATFNMNCLCRENFMLEPESIRFLLKHGLDLNAHFTHSIDYHKGNDHDSTNKNKHDQAPRREYMRELVCELSKSNKPIVLHNGFIDLAFLYANFYATLPESSVTFAADLNDLFAAGIYDTKYIADFAVHTTASYLEYLFFHSLYDRRNLNVHFEFDADFQLAHYDPLREAQNLDDVDLCQHYSTYGYCAASHTCPKSHRIDHILAAELSHKSKKKRKKGPDEKKEKLLTTTNEASSKLEAINSGNQPHSAGLDSFMTGYVMLNFISKLTDFKQQHQETSGTDENSKPPSIRQLLTLDGLIDFEQKFNFNVYLSGKDYPFMVRKSHFTSNSINHQAKKIKK